MLAVGEAAAAAATFVAESERLTEFIVESERVFVRRLFQEEGDAAGAVAEMMIFELSLAAAVFLMLSMVLLLLLEPALLMLTAPALLLLLLLLLLLVDLLGTRLQVRSLLVGTQMPNVGGRKETRAPTVDPRDDIIRGPIPMPCGSAGVNKVGMIYRRWVQHVVADTGTDSVAHFDQRRQIGGLRVTGRKRVTGLIGAHRIGGSEKRLGAAWM